MEVIRGLYNIQSAHQGCVATIGNFDGLHLGHQVLLAKLRTKSKQLQLPSLAIIFEPQPNEYFMSQGVTARLMRFREKIEALQDQGVDRVLCLKFDHHLARQTAPAFIQQVLWEKLAIKYILVGDDFKFGCQRQGDYFSLKQQGARYGFETECMDTYKLLNERVRSTRIKKLLMLGKVEEAASLLGGAFSIEGRVTHGDKLGRVLGFPTANISLHHPPRPLSEYLR